MTQDHLAVIIMAAGQGKRMKNPDLAKVMHPLCGKPLIEHVVRLAISCVAERIIIVVGHKRESVIDYMQHLDVHCEIAVQAEQLGTAHAVRQAEPLLANFSGDILILSGDAPLTRVKTILAMLQHHKRTNAIVTVLTAKLPDPKGYGRVIRNQENEIIKIVEHKDASSRELAVHEINSGIYVFRGNELFRALRQVTNDNAQGEFYLPDVFEIFRSAGLRMEPFCIEDFDEIRGVNTIEQLDEMERILIDRSGSC